MKVLHIITGLQNGGAEAILNSFCRFDADNSHIVVSLMDFGKYGDGLERAGVKVYCLNQRSGRFSPMAMIHLIKIIRKEAPDAVQTWMLHADLIGGLAARMAGIKFVYWGVHHTTHDPSTSSLSTRLVFEACRWVSWVVPKKIICCSQATYEHLKLSGYASKKLIFVANGYDFERFRPDKSRRQDILEQNNIPPGTVVLGMVGRYTPLKDHENLFAALGLVARCGYAFSCLCIGPNVNDKNTTLLELAKKYGITSYLRLLGPKDNIPEYMNAFNLCVLSSKSEAFPNVLNEAMACGTLCVTTNVGDAACIVGDTGWVCPPRSPEKLAEAIMIAIDSMQNTAEFEQRCRAARERVVNHFSINRMVLGYNDVWKMNVPGK